MIKNIFPILLIIKVMTKKLGSSFIITNLILYLPGRQKQQMVIQ